MDETGELHKTVASGAVDAILFEASRSGREEGELSSSDEEVMSLQEIALSFYYHCYNSCVFACIYCTLTRFVVLLYLVLGIYIFSSILFSRWLVH